MNRIVRVATAAWIAAALPLAGQTWTGPAALEVRVEDAQGKAVAGAEVELAWLLDADAGGPASLTTDGRGRLVVGGLAPGRWALEVRKSGYMTFRAELALAIGEKPEILIASQHFVPGATSTLRVRFAKASGGPAARPRAAAASAERATPPAVASASPAAPAPAPAAAAPTPTAPPPDVALAAPAAPAPAPAAAAPTPTAPPPVVAPAAPAAPAPAPAAPTPPAPAPAVAPPAPVAEPAPVAAQPLAKAAPPVVAGPPAAAPSVPAEAPAPAEPAAAPVAPPPAPTPSVRVTPPAAAAPPPAAEPLAPTPARPAEPPATAERECVGCRRGESALAVAADVAGGDSCAAELPARLRQAPLDEFAALIAALPAGCAVLRLELPPTARYTGFRYGAGGPGAAAEDCLPGKDCPAGGGRFLGPPIVRWDGTRQIVLAIFESAMARRAELTAFVGGARR